MSAAEPFDVSDITAHVSIGAPITREQMLAEQRAAAAEPAAPLPDEPNPYVYDDAVVNEARYMAVSVVGPGMRKQHDGGLTLIKLRAAYASVEEAMEQAPKLPPDGADTLLMEMYHFSILPCDDRVLAMTADERDGLMNECLKSYNAMRVDSRTTFDTRKGKMRADMERQEGLRKQFNEGMVDASELDSACVCPEPVVDAPQAAPAPQGAFLPSDASSTVYTHCVLAIVSMAEVDDAGYDVPEVMRGRSIVKICGAFKQESQAHEHALELRKLLPNRHMDLFVVCTSEWLQCPPDVDLLPEVKYEQDKLTEALGSLHPKQTPSQVMDYMMAVDNPVDAA